MAKKNIIFNGVTDQTAYFNEADELKKRKTFSKREVGLTHPDTSAFVRLNDRGEIEIFAGEELGIIISPNSRSISIFADVVKIHTKEDDGLRWNNMSLNYAADVYNEPALLKTSEKEINSGFNYAEYYLNNAQETDPLERDNNIITIQGEYAFRDQADEVREEAPFKNAPTTIDEQSLALLKEYALTSTQDRVDYMKKLLELGFTFSQAREKTVRDKGV